MLWPQPAVVALNIDRDFSWNHDDVMCSREDMEKRVRQNATVPFAVLHDGKWYERGEMGWWATVANEKDGDQWAEEVSKLIGSVLDYVLFLLYDCHI